jgi:DNA-binding NtrC family response regulator
VVAKITLRLERVPLSVAGLATERQEDLPPLAEVQAIQHQAALTLSVAGIATARQEEYLSLEADLLTVQQGLVPSS